MTDDKTNYRQNDMTMVDFITYFPTIILLSNTNQSCEAQAGFLPSRLRTQTFPEGCEAASEAGGRAEHELQGNEEMWHGGVLPRIIWGKAEMD